LADHNRASYGKSLLAFVAGGKGFVGIHDAWGKLVVCHDRCAQRPTSTPKLGPKPRSA
jgi:hypothetical protein